MDYKAWSESELKGLFKSMGYRLTPREEIDQRIAKLRTGMEKDEMDGVLVIQKMDLYYFSGTAQDCLLYIPLRGDPLLMVKRELNRAKLESPLDRAMNVRSLRDLPSIINEHFNGQPKILGLELDVLPVLDYFRLKGFFPDTRFKDVSHSIKNLRKIKSPFEIELIRSAGKIGEKVFLEAKGFLEKGMTEIAFGGLMEAAAKKYGHEGLLRVRSLNYEAYSWHILSGVTGGIVSQSDSPMGGLGLSPAFPVGASSKIINAHEPILVDFGTCFHGYQADETRVFSIGKMDQKFIDAYKVCHEIHDAVLDDVKPGVDCETLYRNTLNMAKRLGYGDNYLGPSGMQTRFIGHGIGLELNEYPFLAQGHTYPLEVGMTFALEPKIVFPGEGAVGLENTVLVTSDGWEILTPLEQGIFEL